MVRRIIKIDEALCTGCGICVAACHEGAIEIIDGKAKLTREHYCDGLGDCLPECPTGAISFEEREAPAYDEAAVASSKAEKSSGCPGARYSTIRNESKSGTDTPVSIPTSRLSAWPCQIRLASPLSPCFDGADLLIAADCTAYAYANFHEDFMKDRVTLVGCPKLDPVDYTGKLTEIVSRHDIKSVTVVRMEVPCCGGIERAARIAAGSVPFRIVTLSTDGRIL